ncbi:hypothetical protein [Actinomadura fibrosa]|uniref:Uncharacterized protein n=1 Tax=Actinomadura fibrosa TaxID=111802 RepID=A0ABW2XQU3_9ACTN|nr:hypothetical protein [Actinomadura fibrosa]
MDARTCTNHRFHYVLGWVGLDYRIRRIERPGSSGDQIVTETPTPTPREQIEQWWQMLLDGRAM